MKRVLEIAGALGGIAVAVVAWFVLSGAVAVVADLVYRVPIIGPVLAGMLTR